MSSPVATPSSDPASIASHWLSMWAKACTNADVNAFDSLFLPHGVYRDLLCLSWDFHSLNGRGNIAKFLGDDTRLARAGFHDIELDEDTEFGSPFFYPIPGAPSHIQGIQFSFTLRISTPAATAKGLTRLMKDLDGEWKALTCFTTMWDFVGHEEAAGSLIEPTAENSWTKIRTNKIAQIETDPTVLIVGGAQNGLLTAARLSQMGIPTLVIEREARVGDTWRQRYDSLKLHTFSRICSCLYESWPTNFPQYLPKDRLADALEAYVKSQDLVVWTSSSVQPKPTYNAESGRWSVTVLKNGTAVQLHPKHIVMATGFAGEPVAPKFLGQEKFEGEVFHSSRRPSVEYFAGKNIVVVGAGQSAADACHDFVRNGANKVTMVQRSATCVISLPLVERNVYSLWPETRSVDASDFAVNAFPSSLLVQLAANGGTVAEKAVDKNMHKGLTDAGLKLTWGEEYGRGEIGMFGVLLQKFGGYWLDQGVSAHITSGRVGVKQGVEVSHYDADGLVFADGEKIQADAVILATGYKDIRNTATKIFGKDTIEGTSEVWGLDDEGEIRGMYRPTGHPGLWYAVGGFNHARFYSRHLGLLILAKDLGLRA